MIKINLLKSQGAVSPDDFGAASLSASAGMSKEDQSELIKKLLFMLIPVISLMAYEWYNIDFLTQQRNRVRAQQNSKEAQLKAIKEEMKLYADVEQEAKVLEDKIGILKELSRIRLREVKALDFVQSVTPDAVWFKSIVYKKLRFTFQGFAVTDDALSVFIRELENSAYFTDVILLKATEEKRAEGTVKVFEVQANSGGVG